MKEKHEISIGKWLAGGLLSLFIVAFLMTPISKPVEGAATSTQATTSNVTVNVYVSIVLSPNLAAGVQFGNVDPGTNDNPATNCDNNLCNITVSSDTNVNVDIVLKANAALTRQGGTETIPNSGYTWNATTSPTIPELPGYALQITYDYTNKVGSNLAPGTTVIWKAWLDIPARQRAGTYNNTLYFCGDETGTTNCGS
jgi:hypothetical protein